MIHLRSHDYPLLIRRWRRAAAAAGLTLQAFAKSGGYPIYCLSSKPSAKPRPAIYFSAGIHGDESAATEGLISWVEKNPRIIRNFHADIFPCLNPWGLVNNNRLDIRGRDLNRCYNKPHVPQIRAQLKIFSQRRFDLALTLHEDYDARGLYIYEVPGKRPFWAEDLLIAASRHVPSDPRSSIEGRRAKNGIVRRKVSPDMMPDWPEALLLHFTHASRTFTIETPSEFSIDARVAAQEAVIGLAVKKCLAEFQPPNPDRR
ncbi:MAG: M14 family metallopeptidase [Terrimicrobiaceae bacterium]